jgi:hypothetical protein
MRKYLLLSSLLVLAGLATIRLRAADESPSADAATEGAQAPLIPNGGFEEIRTETGDPVGWFGTRLPRTAGRFDLSIATAPAHNGQHSVMVSIGQNHPDERVDYNWTIDAQGWQAGETFELVGWIKVENATHPAVMMAQFLDEFGQRLLGAATTEKSSPIVGTADWTKVSTRFVVPEGTRIVRIRTGLSSQGNSGAKAWFDDLSLVKVAP